MLYPANLKRLSVCFYLYKKSDQNRDLGITWIETASTISFKLSSLSSTQIEYIFRLLLKISVSGWLSRDLINFFYRPILSRMATKTLSVLNPPWTVSVEAECIFIIFNWTVLTNISMYCWLTQSLVSYLELIESHWTSNYYSGSARTLDPTNKNYAPELSTFGIIIEVNQSEVQWTSLTLGEPPSWSGLTPVPGKYVSRWSDVSLYTRHIQ